MATTKDHLEGIEAIRDGRIDVRSEEGRTLIREALRADAEETVRFLLPVDRDGLREAMRETRLPESRVAELLHSGEQTRLEIKDPFPEKREPEVLSTPFPDPADVIRNGPRPPWA